MPNRQPQQEISPMNNITTSKKDARRVRSAQRNMERLAALNKTLLEIDQREPALLAQYRRRHITQNRPYTAPEGTSTNHLPKDDIYNFSRLMSKRRQVWDMIQDDIRHLPPEVVTRLNIDASTQCIGIPIYSTVYRIVEHTI